jgi:CHAD domain-containing protein
LAQRAGQHVDAAVIDQIRSDLRIERGRIAAWAVDELTREDLWQAILRSYRRARKSMRVALHDRTTTAIHTWRKRVKVLWHHTQFLAQVNLAELEPQIERLRKLARTLGEYHDLVVLDELCLRSQESFGSARYVKAFRHFIARRLSELEKKAADMGQEILDDRARAWMAKVRVPEERERVGPKKSPQRAAARPAISA